MGQTTLDMMTYSQEGTIVAIDPAVRRQLASMGIRTGKTVKMITKEPLKGPVVLLVDQANISLGIGIADKIAVEVRE